MGTDRQLEEDHEEAAFWHAANTVSEFLMQRHAVSFRFTETGPTHCALRIIGVRALALGYCDHGRLAGEPHLTITLGERQHVNEA